MTSRRTSPARRRWWLTGVYAAVIAAGFALSWSGWVLVAFDAAVRHVIGGGR